MKCNTPDRAIGERDGGGRAFSRRSTADSPVEDRAGSPVKAVGDAISHFRRPLARLSLTKPVLQFT